jgi:NADH:ubiquinone oxidoreductase subunit 3 (subunit A)
MSRKRIEVLFLGSLLSLLLFMPLVMLLFQISLFHTEEGVVEFMTMALYFMVCSLVAIRFGYWKSP